MYAEKTASTNIFSRFWVYQAERFPVLGHGLLIAAFSFSAVSFSTLLRGRAEWPAVSSLWVGFVSAFLFFLLLRLADEFKDAAEDARYRPYRPVPRGLVTLTELGGLAVLSLLVQVGLAWWLEPTLTPLLLFVWGYLALMSKEFFVRSWLRARPLTYMGTHMVIVPLIDFYTTACDWRVAGEIVGRNWNQDQQISSLWLLSQGIFWGWVCLFLPFVWVVGFSTGSLVDTLVALGGVSLAALIFYRLQPVLHHYPTDQSRWFRQAACGMLGSLVAVGPLYLL